MYAVVKIKNQQFRVSPEATLQVPLFDNEVGDTLNFDEVLLIGDGDDVKVGSPTIEGASVSAEVIESVARTIGVRTGTVSPTPRSRSPVSPVNPRPARLSGVGR